MSRQLPAALIPVIAEQYVTKELLFLADDEKWWKKGQCEMILFFPNIMDLVSRLLWNHSSSFVVNKCV